MAGLRNLIEELENGDETTGTPQVLLSHNDAGALVIRLMPGHTLVVETAAGQMTIATDSPNDVEDQTQLTIAPSKASWVYSLDQPDAATTQTGVSGFTITMQSRENAF